MEHSSIVDGRVVRIPGSRDVFEAPVRPPARRTPLVVVVLREALMKCSGLDFTIALSTHLPTSISLIFVEFDVGHSSYPHPFTTAKYGGFQDAWCSPPHVTLSSPISHPQTLTRGLDYGLRPITHTRCAFSDEFYTRFCRHRSSLYDHWVIPF